MVLDSKVMSPPKKMMADLIPCSRMGTRQDKVHSPRSSSWWRLRLNWEHYFLHRFNGKERGMGNLGTKGLLVARWTLWRITLQMYQEKWPGMTVDSIMSLVNTSNGEYCTTGSTGYVLCIGVSGLTQLYHSIIKLIINSLEYANKSFIIFI
jgi:hypothetical protein